MKRKTDHTLDFRGTISTISLLKVTQVFHEMKPMETMEILVCDADTRKDLFKVLPEASYDLICNDEIKAKTCYHRVRLRKKLSGVSTRPDGKKPKKGHFTNGKGFNDVGKTNQDQG